MLNVLFQIDFHKKFEALHQYFIFIIIKSFSLNISRILTTLLFLLRLRPYIHQNISLLLNNNTALPWKYFYKNLPLELNIIRNIFHLPIFGNKLLLLQQIRISFLCFHRLLKKTQRNLQSPSTIRIT